VARNTHAPRARALFELGLNARPAGGGLPGDDGRPAERGGGALGHPHVERDGADGPGCVDLGFIGGAEVDRFGNLNTSYVGDSRRPRTKLPGSGEERTSPCLSRRWVTLMSHERRRLVERVSYVTSPGLGDGTPRWRERNGLLGGGPAAIVTTMAVLRFPEGGGEAQLASVHPGCTVEGRPCNTGWDLQMAPDVTLTPPPTTDELAQLRKLDPDGFWTRGP